MKTLILLLFPVCMMAQTVIGPRALVNNATHTASLECTSTSTYIFVVSLSGNGHFVVETQAVFNGIASSWLELDSGQWTGATRLTLSVTGDSIKNVWLPDDDGSLGEAGAVVKAASGWKMILRIRAKSSGNGGTVAVYKYDGPTYTPPIIAYDGWIRRSDSSIVFITPQWFWSNMIASSGVTTAQLTDSLNLLPRSAVTVAQLTDSLNTIPRAPGVTVAQLTDSLNLIPREALTMSEVATRISDSTSARALALGDSLLSMRGFVRLHTGTAIKDSVDKFNRRWMMADTLTIGGILDLMYPRTATGGVVDTTKSVSMDRDDLTVRGEKTFLGAMTIGSGGSLTAGSGTVVNADSLRSGVAILDSAKWVTSDTSKWRIVSMDAPDHIGKYYTGVVRLKIQINAALPLWGNIRADSAAGVSLRTVYATVRGVKTLAYNGGTHTWRSAFAPYNGSVSSTKEHNGSAVGSSLGNVDLLFYIPNGGTGGYIPFCVTQTEGADAAFITMEIEYIQTVGSAPVARPVYIEGL